MECNEKIEKNSNQITLNAVINEFSSSAPDGHHGRTIVKIL